MEDMQEQYLWSAPPMYKQRLGEGLIQIHMKAYNWHVRWNYINVHNMLITYMLQHDLYLLGCFAIWRTSQQVENFFYLKTEINYYL